MSKGRTVPEVAELVSPPRLEFTIPGPEAPGFLRRQREALRCRDELRTNASLAAMDAMIDFLAQFVTAPTDPELARSLLLDLSRNDYNNLLSAVTREDPDFLP